MSGAGFMAWGSGFMFQGGGLRVEVSGVLPHLHGRCVVGVLRRRRCCLPPPLPSTPTPHLPYCFAARAMLKVDQLPTETLGQGSDSVLFSREMATLQSRSGPRPPLTMCRQVLSLESCHSDMLGCPWQRRQHRQQRVGQLSSHRMY